MSLVELPADVLLLLLRMVAPSDVGCVASTCKRLHSVLSSSSDSTSAFWRDACARELGVSEGTRAVFAKLWGRSKFGKECLVERFSTVQHAQSGAVIGGGAVVMCGEGVVSIVRDDVVIQQLSLPAAYNWLPSCCVVGTRILIGGADPGAISGGPQPIFVAQFDSQTFELRQLDSLECHIGRVVGLAAYRDCVVSVSWSGQAFVWSVKEGCPIELEGEITHDMRECFCAAVCGKYICLGAQSGNSALFSSVAPFKRIRQFPKMEPYVLSCSFQQDDSELLMSDSSGWVQRVEVASGMLIVRVKICDRLVRKTLVTPRGQVVCACSDGIVRVLSWSDLSTQCEISTGHISIRTLVFCRDQAAIVVGLKSPFDMNFESKAALVKIQSAC